MKIRLIASSGVIVLFLSICAFAQGRALAPRASWAGHTDVVHHVAFLPDGRRAVTGGLDKTIRIREVSTGRELLVIETDHPVNVVAISPDGRLLASAERGDFRLWRLKTGRLIGSFKGPKGNENNVIAVVFSGDGRTVLSGYADGTIRTWSARSLKPILVLKGHEHSAYAVTYSLDGLKIYSGATDKTVRVWDAATGAPLDVWRAHTGSVRSVAVSTDGAKVLSAGYDGTLRQWDARTGRALGSRVVGGVVNAVVFLPDGRVLTGGRDSTPQLWDPELKQLIAVLRGHQGPVESVAVSRDGKTAISGSWDKTAMVWDLPGAASDR